MQQAEVIKKRSVLKNKPLLIILIVAAVLITAAVVFVILFKGFDKDVAAKLQQIYADVPREHSAFIDIAAMKGYGIMEGYEDGFFKPDETVSRAQFSKMMAAALDIEGIIPAWDTYEDVAQNNTFYQYIAAVKIYLPGYIQDGKLMFKPDAPITNEEALGAMLKATGIDIRTAANAPSEKLLDGNGLLTRAQASILLNWYITERLPKVEGELEILYIK